MKFLVRTRLSKHGFEVLINNDLHRVVYPSDVWAALPLKLRLVFAEMASFLGTIHFSYSKANRVVYDFPIPVGEPFYSYGQILAMPENLTDYDKPKYKTSHYLRYVLNGFYKTSFADVSRDVSFLKHTFTPNKKNVLVPFSFGKDSLLTYALCKEFGLNPILIFMVEPKNHFENAHKRRLIERFEKEFKEKIISFPVPLAELKQSRGFSWGWDNYLTQYTVFLVPFLYHYRAAFLFWSNEHECNETTTDQEGFMVNATFDQSERWMFSLNAGVRLFGCSTHIGSILAPLSELAITGILHYRYPELAQYQMSCFSDHPRAKTKRWCRECFECARVYIFLKTLRIDHARVEFGKEMTPQKVQRLLHLFLKSDRNPTFWEGKFPLTSDQLQFAFFAAFKESVVKKLVTKKVMSKFKKSRSSIADRIFTLYPSQTIPWDLRKDIREFYKQELINVRKRLNS